MRTAKELYQCGSEKYFPVYDYQPMIEEIGSVVVQVDDNDYQGDSRVLYQNGEKIGYLNFGWGSCSGCDVLQGCSSIEEVQELFDQLVKDVKWFDSKEAALKYFTNKDWELEYTWHAEEQRDFLKRVTEFLSREEENGTEP